MLYANLVNKGHVLYTFTRISKRLKVSYSFGDFNETICVRKRSALCKLSALQMFYVKYFLQLL